MRWNVVWQESRRRLLAPIEELAIWLPETVLGWLVVPFVVVLALSLGYIALGVLGFVVLFVVGVEDFESRGVEASTATIYGCGVGAVVVAWFTNTFVLPLLKEWSDWATKSGG